MPTGGSTTRSRTSFFSSACQRFPWVSRGRSTLAIAFVLGRWLSRPCELVCQAPRLEGTCCCDADPLPACRLPSRPWPPTSTIATPVGGTTLGPPSGGWTSGANAEARGFGRRFSPASASGGGFGPVERARQGVSLSSLLLSPPRKGLPPRGLAATSTRTSATPQEPRVLAGPHDDSALPTCSFSSSWGPMPSDASGDSQDHDMTAHMQTSFQLGSSDLAAVGPVAEVSLLHNVGGECHVCGRDSRITPRLETCVDCRRIVCVGTCIHWYPEGSYYGFSWLGGWSCSNCFGNADASEADPDDDAGSDESNEPHGGSASNW